MQAELLVLLWLACKFLTGVAEVEGSLTLIGHSKEDRRNPESSNFDWNSKNIRGLSVNNNIFAI
jgi:hypothetical protein